MFHILAITQTPLVRFRADADEILKRLGHGQGPVDLRSLREGEDYVLSPGGVTRMVYPFLARLVSMGDRPWWVSLNPRAPRFVEVDGIRIYHVSLAPERIKGYGEAKETIWGAIHMIEERLAKAPELLWSEEYIDYVYYNRRVAQAVAVLDPEEDFDIIYVHDFQHIPLGSMLPPAKPRIFRWHIPLERSLIPAEWVDALGAYMKRFNLVVVSSERYARALRELGYGGAVRVAYPYVDPSLYRRPPRAEVEDACSRLGIDPQDRVVLVVARMDPMKGQDRAVKALKPLLRKIPEARLVLAGDGSFSSSRGGMGLSKGERWAAHLSRLSRELGVEDRVTITGYVSQRDLEALYSRADVVLLPSVVEGFGLVVVEAWLYGKPAVVSRRAGVADLVVDGENGLLVDPDDVEGLSEALLKILTDSEHAEKLGRGGKASAEICSLERGLRAELAMIEEVLGGGPGA